MRAVHLSVSPDELRERRATGQDRFDEMWEGELHMVPPPSWEHQDISDALCEFLRAHCRRYRLGTVRSGAGVHDPECPDKDYRIPDLTFVAVGNERVIQPRGVVGAADAVVEVRSPDDETYEKFSFYARLGVREVIVIDRDTREPEVYRLAGKEFVAVSASSEGWVTAGVLRLRLRRRTRGKRRALELQSERDSRRTLVI